MRREVVKRIETVVKDLWPAADVGLLYIFLCHMLANVGTPGGVVGWAGRSLWVRSAKAVLLQLWPWDGPQSVTQELVRNAHSLPTLHLAPELWGGAVISVYPTSQM